MSDIREKLARAILVNAMCTGQEYIATRVAGAILADAAVLDAICEYRARQINAERSIPNA